MWIFNFFPTPHNNRIQKSQTIYLHHHHHISFLNSVISINWTPSWKNTHTSISDRCSFFLFFFTTLKTYLLSLFIYDIYWWWTEKTTCILYAANELFHHIYIHFMYHTTTITKIIIKQKTKIIDLPNFNNDNDDLDWKQQHWGFFFLKNK